MFIDEQSIKCLVAIPAGRPTLERTIKNAANSSKQVCDPLTVMEMITLDTHTKQINIADFDIQMTSILDSQCFANLVLMKGTIGSSQVGQSNINEKGLMINALFPTFRAM